MRKYFKLSNEKNFDMRKVESLALCEGDLMGHLIISSGFKSNTVGVIQVI